MHARGHVAEWTDTGFSYFPRWERVDDGEVWLRGPNPVEFLEEKARQQKARHLASGSLAVTPRGPARHA